ncbi:MAG TPA: SAM-dependent methyltransferase, partial [Puia sp.]|nr:SAM-dependent methyltransferase [Puia sp.]
AGDRGLQMAQNTPNSGAMAFAMTVRTTAIDGLISKAISFGIDTVINMAAGLDTRPYRMTLPSSLKWIEVDLPSIIEYKNEKLKNEIPHCQLERVTADLAADDQRKILFETIGRRTMKALIITEGLVAYLKPQQAENLSKDIFQVPSFVYWIQDYSRGSLRRARHTRQLSKMVKQTPFQFDVKDPLSFFSRQGWKVKENILILDEADRIGRRLPFLFPWTLFARLFPSLIRRTANQTYGYVMFAKE